MKIRIISEDPIEDAYVIDITTTDDTYCIDRTIKELNNVIDTLKEFKEK